VRALVEKAPKVGDRIAIEKFHVSVLNVRSEEDEAEFGKSEDDQVLIHQVRMKKKLVQPIKARIEKDGYGIYIGRRRFLAKKKLGSKFLVVGQDVIFEEVDEEEGKEDSLIENLKMLKTEVDPIVRARALQELIASRPDGMTGTARRLGISKSRLSEWLKVLELTPKMQDKVSKGLMAFQTSLEVARMKLGSERQDELAETLETKGLDEFKKEIERQSTGQMRRGIPPGKYVIDRVVWDKVYKPDMEAVKKLDQLAEAKHMARAEYDKWVLLEHVKANA